MPVLNIFNDSEKKEFDSIPRLNDELRKEYFNLGNRDPSNDYFRKSELLVGYILLKGYFLSFGRFYGIKDFNQEETDYICDKVGISSLTISNRNYPESSYRRHKNLICEKYTVTLFKDWKEQFVNETNQLVKTTLKPKQIISHLIQILREKKVEIPSYFVFADTISTSLNQFENDLIEKLDLILEENQKNTLESILTMPTIPGEPISPSNPYFLTTIKKPEQSEAPLKIKKSLEEFQSIYDLFQEFSTVLNQLEVSDQLLNYYAVWLIKSKHVTFLAVSDPNKKYLYLLSFIIYQFRIRQDLFVDLYIKAIQKFKNETEKSIAQDFLEQKPVRNEQTRKIINAVRSLTDQFDHMRQLTYSINHSDSEKISHMKQSFEEWDQSKEDRLRERRQLEKELENLELSLSSGLKEQMLVEKYVQGYRKLHNRVGGILRALTFNSNTSNKNIIEAIDFFKDEKSNPKQKPLGFLNEKDRKNLKSLDTTPAFSLYKVLLFLETSNHIKAGSLNLSNSEKYRAVEEYLIPENVWESQKQDLMERAGLNLESIGIDFIQRIRGELNSQYEKTNSNATNNEYLAFTNSGKPKVITPKLENEETNGLLSLLEEKEIIPLPRILAEINRSSCFLESFQHFSKKNHKKPPNQQVFFATIIALGCNLGVRRMSKISKGVSLDRLSNLVQWYFSKENLDQASAKINDFTNQLSLPEVFKKVGDEMHTSSDGQKFNVSVPSINASYSYKYFGSGKGITAYSFIDEYSRLYYNTVISASEREAAYVIDGLMHNKDVESDIHSTDTHGYSEIVFAITNGLGVFFAPRIKNYKDQLLYSFRGNSRRDFEKRGFTIKPSAPSYIDENLIIEQWESILRVIVTIKLGITTASRILKRLSSYSKQHPLYRALKQLGRIYKTIFILKYLDDINLRQSTEKALNRIEQSHQFAKAIFFGNNQELKQATQEEQEVAVGSRHLIQNAIVLWNYLRISELLLKAETKEIFEDILKTVKSGSIMTWQHINIHGEYDFELELNGIASAFDMEDILALELN